jgi:hypothetical protein
MWVQWAYDATSISGLEQRKGLRMGITSQMGAGADQALETVLR